jgi:hypothetical protein
MRRRIVALLQEHPEGLTPAEMRPFLGIDAMIHRLQLRLFFFSSLMTVVGLTCSTRAVSRMPLAFIAMSTICCLILAE